MTKLSRIRLVLGAAAVSCGLVLGSTPSVVAVNAVAALPDWRTTPTSWDNDRARAPKVRDLRYARHKRFDRVVIDVAGRRPGYTIRYAPRLSFDGSGATVPLRGARKIALSLRPAYAHDGSGASVYDGPRLRQLDLPTLRGIAFTGDFEGVVSFGFSTDRRAAYRIFTLTNPSRVVIDFRH